MTTPNTSSDVVELIDEARFLSTYDPQYGHVFGRLADALQSLARELGEVKEELNSSSGVRVPCPQEDTPTQHSAGKEPRELHCEDCDQDYTVWYADNDLWNLVMRGPGSEDRPEPFLCARCFLIRAERFTEIARVTWPETPSRRDAIAATSGFADVCGALSGEVGVFDPPADDREPSAAQDKGNLRARLLRCGCPECIEALGQIDGALVALRRLVRAIERYEDIPVRYRRDDEAWVLDRLGHEVGGAFLGARTVLASAGYAGEGRS